MRRTLSIALALLMVTQLAPAALGADSVSSQLTAIPVGAKIEVHLKNEQTLRGAKGTFSNAGFRILDARNREHEIALDEVVSVKQLSARSLTTRNVLIGIGIGVAALGITAGILLRCGPLGCGNRASGF